MNAPAVLKDPNDVLRVHGPDKLREAMDAARNAPPPPDWMQGEETFAALMKRKLPPIRYVVPDFVPEGLTILGGKSKIGKSWRALDWVLAVGVCTLAMGKVRCERGDVFYLALEDSDRSLQGRIQQLTEGRATEPDLSRITYRTKAPVVGDDLIDGLEYWRRKSARPVLVVVDTLAYVRPPRDQGKSAYMDDADAIKPLKQWSSQHGIAVVIIHHTRKMGADDPLETVSGTNGLVGVADNILVLDRQPSGTTLYGRGRFPVRQESALTLHPTGHWELVGDAATVRMSDQRRAILKAIEDAGEPLGPKDIAAASGQPETNVRQLVRTMAKAGELTKTGRGLYALPSTPHHNDHNITFEGGDPPHDDDAL